MKQVYISDDGKCQGDEATVATYEAGLKNPLAKMRFPYVTSRNNVIGMSTYTVDLARTSPDEFNALIAFANLAPLIQRCFEYGMVANTPLIELQRAYNEACELAKNL